ncbi:MAG: hypothetical protein JXA33_07125 [Anaerolineae bacterium]|nr:hypothetical protein [Anaerolineae bacterium]
MNLNDLLHDIHSLEDEIRVYERKYNILSEVFYESYQKGEEPADDAWVLDWTAWASAYELLHAFQQQYRAAIAKLQAETPSMSDVIARTSRRESINVPV